jgi:hypothetical protein
MAEGILSYLRTVALASLLQIGIFFVPGLILTLIMNYVSILMQRRALLTIGKGWYLGLFGWLGTIIHEAGHAIFCLIFLHKITTIKLFDPDPETGTLGYVEHTYSSSSVYQQVGNFFIGMGPILLGTAMIYLLLYLLLGLNPFNFIENGSITPSHIYSWGVLTQVFHILWSASSSILSVVFSRHNLSTWRLYVFIYLTFAIGSSITLSPSDIKGTLKGLSIILILIFIFNLATAWVADLTSKIFNGTISYFLVFYIAMFLILVLDISVTFLLLLPLSLLTNRNKALNRF